MAEKKLKSVIIIGPEHSHTYEKLSSFTSKEGLLIIGDGNRRIQLEELYILKGKIDASTRIDILAHGEKGDEGHIIDLFEEGIAYTKAVFALLNSCANGNPLFVNLWSCFGGQAIDDVKYLPLNSILFTFASENKESLAWDGELISRALPNIYNKAALMNPFQNFVAGIAYLLLNPVSISLNIEDKTRNIKLSPNLIGIKFNPRLKDVFKDSEKVISLTVEVLNDFIKDIRGSTPNNYKKTYLDIPPLGIPKLKGYELKFFQAGNFIYNCYMHNNDDIENILRNQDEYKLYISKAKLVNYIIDGISAIDIASYNGFKDTAKLLLDNGANPSLINIESYTSPLLTAIKKRHFEVAKLLLDYGADPNFADRHGTTSLLLTVENGNLEITKKLLMHGADPNLFDFQGLTPLLIAVQNGFFEIAEVLLKNGADINFQANEEVAPLFMASLKNDAKIVKLLLENKADPNLKTYIGAYPLHMATQNKNFKILNELLKHGANTDVENSGGQTPLFVAASERFQEGVKLLLSKKADPNLSDNDGFSPLHAASEEGSLDIVKLLIEHKAIPWEPNTKNITPLMIAKYHNHEKVYQFLREKYIKAGHDVTFVPSLFAEIYANKFKDTGVYLSQDECREGYEPVFQVAGYDTIICEPTHIHYEL